MASYDPKTDSYSLRACSQSAGTVRNQTAPVLGVPNEKLRVTTEDVGGAFGMKTPVYPEYPAVCVAAQENRAAGGVDVHALRSLHDRYAGPGHGNRNRARARRGAENFLRCA